MSVRTAAAHRQADTNKQLLSPIVVTHNRQLHTARQVFEVGVVSVSGEVGGLAAIVEEFEAETSASVVGGFEGLEEEEEILDEAAALASGLGSGSGELSEEVGATGFEEQEERGVPPDNVRRSPNPTKTYITA